MPVRLKQPRRLCLDVPTEYQHLSRLASLATSHRVLDVGSLKVGIGEAFPDRLVVVQADDGLALDLAQKPGHGHVRTNKGTDLFSLL